MNIVDGFAYDIIVVGSGAGGSMAAHTLVNEGHSVLLLEAGRDYDPYTETPMFGTAAEAPLRGAPTPDKNFGFYDATVDGGWAVPGEPYTVAEGSEFKWWRARMLGGRTNHWGRYTPRFSHHDFNGFSRDGHGADWPLDYRELSSWYDRTEALVGICGNNPGLEDVPDSGSGVLLPPPVPRVPELLVRAACNKLDIPTAPMRRAVLTRPKEGRSACFYATNCIKGCSIGAAFQTTTSLLPEALKTGRMKIITDAMVKRVDADETGKVTAIEYVDRKTGGSVTLKARLIVLAASACESARILLNSRSASFPKGLANSSGLVGRNLMDSTGVDIHGYIPGLEGRPRYNEDGHTGCHLYIPWWGHKAQARGELDFARGYHFELMSGFIEPDIRVGFLASGYGEDLKDRVLKGYGSTITLSMRGEMIPNAGCFMEIDPSVKDKWGIPVPRFRWQWGNQELKQVEHSLLTARRIIKTMGGKVLGAERSPEEAISKGGEIIHEVGTTRMGEASATSVTNQFGQTWDCKNLFIMDGGVFPSSPHKNCTLTIMALAMRNASWLSGEIRKGAL